MEIGQKFESKRYGSFRIESFEKDCYALIRFCGTKTLVKAEKQHILTGAVRDPYFPNIHGKGFTGKGRFKTTNSSIANRWRNMLARCYNPNYHNYSRYGGKGVTVDPLWFNFQNFAEWFYTYMLDHHPGIDPMSNHGLHLDKDSIVPGNKVYGPDFCKILSPSENSVIAHKGKGKRGSFIHEDGTILKDITIKDFYKNYLPSETPAYHLLNGKRESYHGWRVYKDKSHRK